MFKLNIHPDIISVLNDLTHWVLTIVLGSIVSYLLYELGHIQELNNGRLSPFVYRFINMTGWSILFSAIFYIPVLFSLFLTRFLIKKTSWSSSKKRWVLNTVHLLGLSILFFICLRNSRNDALLFDLFSIAAVTYTSIALYLWNKKKVIFRRPSARKFYQI